jgi:hypothetical protein
MFKTLFLHIGLHKTGTTSIQVSLSKNKKELLERGYYVPLTGVPLDSQEGHHNIPAEFGGFSHFQVPQSGGMNKLLHEITNSNENKYILSSENFIWIFKDKGLSNEFITSLKSLFSRIKVIVYLRNPSDLVESLYAEVMASSIDDIQSWFSIEDQRVLAMQGFKGFIKSNIFKESPILQIDNIIDNVKKTGCEVNIRVFDDAIKKGIFVDFLEAIECPIPETILSPVARGNNRHTFSAVAFSRRMLRYRLTHQLNHCSLLQQPAYRYALGKPFRVMDSQLKNDIDNIVSPLFNKVLQENNSGKYSKPFFPLENTNSKAIKSSLNRVAINEVKNNLLRHLTVGGTFIDALVDKTSKLITNNSISTIGYYELDYRDYGLKVFSLHDYFDTKLQYVINNSLKSSSLIGRHTSVVNIDTPKPGDPLSETVILEGWVRPAQSFPQLPRIVITSNNKTRSISTNISRPDVLSFFSLPRELSKFEKCGFRIELNACQIRAGVLFGLECDGIIKYLVKIVI